MILLEKGNRSNKTSEEKTVCLKILALGPDLLTIGFFLRQ